MFLSVIHSSFLSVWDVCHDGIRKKPAEKTVLENMEHDPMSHIEIRNEHGGNSILGLSLMEEYKRNGPADKLLWHDNKSKGIRGATQPAEEKSLTS